MDKQNKGEAIRAFIDLAVDGNAKGGLYMKNKRLHNKIKEIESDGYERVVGIVYDETDNIEFVTKPTKEIELLKDNKLLN
jgi:hypothetical protein